MQQDRTVTNPIRGTWPFADLASTAFKNVASSVATKVGAAGERMPR
jgi:hypothetical protein